MRYMLMSLIAVIGAASPSASALAQSQGDQRGQRAFGACAACHSLEPNRNMTGPSLANLWNRQAGSLQSFDRYSDALKSSKVIWDDKSLDEGVRKRLQVEQAPHKSARAKILKLADKISNVHAIAVSPPASWSHERRRDYIRWGREVVAGLAGVAPALERKFQQVADDADKAIRGDGS